MTLLELAVLFSDPRQRVKRTPADLFRDIEFNPIFEIVPFSVAVAVEVTELGDHLRDPGDRAIVATARVHGLTLLTSDQRIIDSKLVRVVD